MLVPLGALCLLQRLSQPQLGGTGAAQATVCDRHLSPIGLLPDPGLEQETEGGRQAGERR